MIIHPTSAPWLKSSEIRKVEQRHPAWNDCTHLRGWKEIPKYFPPSVNIMISFLRASSTGTVREHSCRSSEPLYAPARSPPYHPLRRLCVRNLTQRLIWCEPQSQTWARRTASPDSSFRCCGKVKQQNSKHDFFLKKIAT